MSEWHEQLRAPFPRETVGVLPKPYSKDSQKGQCRECGGYHGLPAVHLDYVGHAAVTDRLLSVDPEWNWEPLGLDQMGLPALDRDGNLWIKLTVNGHTRLGVGDGRSMKERIGDAIRNAAMRFGVALDLWSKDELESGGRFEPSAPQHVSSPVPTEADQARDELRGLCSELRIDPHWAAQQFQERAGEPLAATTRVDLIRELTEKIRTSAEKKENPDVAA